MKGCSYSWTRRRGCGGRGWLFRLQVAFRNGENWKLILTLANKDTDDHYPYDEDRLRIGQGCIVEEGAIILNRCVPTKRFFQVARAHVILVSVIRRLCVSETTISLRLVVVRGRFSSILYLNWHTHIDFQALNVLRSGTSILFAHDLGCTTQSASHRTALLVLVAWLFLSRRTF